MSYTSKRADEIVEGDVLHDIWMCFESRPYLPNPDEIWLLDWRFRHTDGTWERVAANFEMAFIPRNKILTGITPMYVIPELGVMPA